AHGYWRDPEATSAAFVEIEVAGERVRAYRTGDICRLDDGQLYFAGRRDTMVKLRGHRIELGEVEMVLAREPEVSQVCVLMMDSGKGPELVAFVRAHGDVSLAQLRQAAGQVLPHYMLPARLVQVDSMPLNPTGKIDRARLAESGQAIANRMRDDP
ncbi:MAG: AMP-binding enzyme, partial [Trebonia sp.]